MHNLDNAWDMYIFRDGRRTFSGLVLVNALSSALLTLSGDVHSRTLLMECLLRAGELECALEDARSASASTVASVTNALANALATGTSPNTRKLTRSLEAIEPPDTVEVATPEGFAYYALHPLDYAGTICEAAFNPDTAVIGIRSIGTTLSAVVQAALLSRGSRAERITVRPFGNPYRREVEFTPEQLQWIATFEKSSADFVVVDEGPGISGSSFLSVASALMKANVKQSRITFVASRQPDPTSLKAPDAAELWPSFRSLYTKPTTHLPEDAKHFVGGGAWRTRVFDNEDQWPASWLQMERLKFLSPDESLLYRFEGHGRFGQEVHARACSVAKAGFGPMPLGREEGFGLYPMLRGRSLSTGDATPAVLTRMADYCAFRARWFRVLSKDNSELENMTRTNMGREFGCELPTDFKLECVVHVICDGRMLPHKWIEVGDAILKVDSATHGDDHFFPGPTDIAWDLAGTIVEWELNRDQRSFFLQRYRAASGDAAESRVNAYLLAYSVFRMAYCKVAAASMRGSHEEARLTRAFHKYRAHAGFFSGQCAEEFAVVKHVQGSC